MKITALLAMLGIGFLAWYHYPEPLPDPAAVSPVPAAPAPAPSVPAADGPERAVMFDQRCDQFVGTAAWQDLGEIYPGMTPTELCDFVHVPDLAKIADQEINAEAVQSLLNRLMREGNASSDHLADVPDLRYYLDPQAVASMQGLSQAQLIDKINNERSPEAAYWLAHSYFDDEQTFVMLMMSAASYAQKPGPLLNAINGCCSYTPDDVDGKRAADIKREALIMIAREMNLPEAGDWLEYDLDADIEADVLAQRATYVDELNQYSIEAFGEEWIQ